MIKELHELTLEELWALFPITLENYNENYSKWYLEMKINILNCVGDSNCARINHIGSTAVEGLISKPTIDILLEIEETSNIIRIEELLANDGWGLMNSIDAPVLKYSFCKGYTKYGFSDKVYHLHVKKIGDWDELYFRDYLIENEDVSKKYAELKLRLLEPYRNNRDGYTDAKSEFIKEKSNEARVIYGDRYKYSSK